MTRFLKTAFALLMLLGLGACTSMKVSDFADSNQPELVLEDYFKGRTLAYGVFEDRFGKVRRQFKVIIDGTVEDDGTLVLDEDFYYADGERDKRVWRITRTGDGTYEGRAGDIIGVAEGIQQGNALNWSYRLDLQVGEEEDDTWRVKFDDWMFLQQDGVLINRAWVYRWGFEIGSVTITFFRPETAEALAP